MGVIRWIEVDVLTAECPAGESQGDNRGWEPLAAEINAKPNKRALRLSDSMLLMRDVVGMPVELIDTLGPPTEQVVRLPEAHEVVYDYENDWLKPAPRPTFEEAHGKTVEDFTAEAIAHGAPPAFARATAEAFKGEYDAYDPLEGVHPYGTSIEDIAQAAIVAAEARAARRAG